MERMKRGLLNSKRGDTLITETVIFIVLNLLFFAVMLIFVARSASGAVIYEQAYAKQIALMIDDAKAEMTIFLDMENAIDIARKSKTIGADVSAENVLKEIVRLEPNNNRVIVSLTRSGGYGFQYFSGYDVELEPSGIHLKIKVKEKQNEVKNAV